MISFFQKPVREIGPGDIKQLVEVEHYPEGYELEFKKSLSDKNGKTHPWLTGTNVVDPHARDEILSELIAFANAQGGYVLLGVSETKEKPPRADQIIPLPRIGELARRLEDQARTCIEPALSRLEVHTVETGPGEGVLVFYCGPSNKAPHRVRSSNDSFVRRGSSTVKMTMIEIQEMSVNMERGIARIPELFRNRQSIFSKWSEKDHCSAFRITCIPLRKMPDPGRLFGKVNQDLTFKRYRAQIDGHKVDIQHPITASQVKPILRGARFYSNGSGGSMVVDQLQDGTVDIQFKSDYRDPGFRGKDEFVLYHLWIIGSVAMALEMLDRLRFLAGVPNSEYAMEIEIAQHSANDAPPLEYRGPLNSYGTDAYRIDELPILIRDILVEGVHDFDQVISRIDTDIYDAIGVRNKPREIHIDWAGY